MSRDPIDHFEDQWRREAAKQPPVTPPRTAVTRIRARAAEASRRRWRMRLATVTAVAAVVAATIVWSPMGTPPLASNDGGIRTATSLAPPLGDDVVLLWLDAETPLYLTMTPPSADRGDAR